MKFRGSIKLATFASVFLFCSSAFSQTSFCKIVGAKWDSSSSNNKVTIQYRAGTDAVEDKIYVDVHKDTQSGTKQTTELTASALNTTKTGIDGDAANNGHWVRGYNKSSTTGTATYRNWVWADKEGYSTITIDSVSVTGTPGNYTCSVQYTCDNMPSTGYMVEVSTGMGSGMVHKKTDKGAGNNGVTDETRTVTFSVPSSDEPTVTVEVKTLDKPNTAYIASDVEIAVGGF